MCHFHQVVVASKYHPKKISVYFVLGSEAQSDIMFVNLSSVKI